MIVSLHSEPFLATFEAEPFAQAAKSEDVLPDELLSGRLSHAAILAVAE
jgi:hypothetical protein